MDTDWGGRRFAAAEWPDSPVFAFKAQLAIACDSLRLLAIYALLAWAFRRFSQAVQRSAAAAPNGAKRQRGKGDLLPAPSPPAAVAGPPAAVKRQVACTCMYLHVPATLSLSVRVKPAATWGGFQRQGAKTQRRKEDFLHSAFRAPHFPRPFSRCKMSKNRRVSAAQGPHYHGLVGLQTFSLFFFRFGRWDSQTPPNRGRLGKSRFINNCTACRAGFLSDRLLWQGAGRPPPGKTVPGGHRGWSDDKSRPDIADEAFAPCRKSAPSRPP
jgi:hypothetical protein